MHLSTVRVLIDFGVDWPQSSVLFLISNQLFFSKFCISHSFASFCIYLVRPSQVSVPHPTWHRTYTDSHECGQGPAMDREIVYLYILVRPLEFQPASESAIGTEFYKLISVFAILYTLRMSKFHMPTLINHRNNSKTARPSAFILFDFQAGEACLSVIGPFDMLICSPPVPSHWPWTVNACRRFRYVSSPNVVSGVLGRIYSSKRQSGIALHIRIHIYGQNNF